MGDMGELWKDVKDQRRERRRRFGVPCPKCQELTPKRSPTILLPGQKCRVDGYVDPREREK